MHASANLRLREAHALYKAKRGWKKLGRPIYRRRLCLQGRITSLHLVSLHRNATSEKLTPHLCAFVMVRHYLVKGRVQGVGFRWFVHREAAALALHGWVRNTEDGHVEVLAAGSAEDLSDLGKALREGSRGSRVDAIVEHELDELEGANLGPFKIEGAW